MLLPALRTNKKQTLLAATQFFQLSPLHFKIFLFVFYIQFPWKLLQPQFSLHFFYKTYHQGN